MWAQRKWRLVAQLKLSKKKRDLKGKLYFIKDLLYEKALDLEGFWQDLPNSSFYVILQSKNLEKQTTTKSANNKTQSLSEFQKARHDTPFLN